MNERELPLEIYLQRCKNCGKEFEEEWLNLDMGFDRLVKCLETGELRYYNAFEDQIYNKISKIILKHMKIEKIRTEEEVNKFYDYVDRVYYLLSGLLSGSKFRHKFKGFCPFCGTKGKDNFEKLKTYKEDRIIKQMEYKDIEDIELENIVERVFKERDQGD